MRVALQAPFGTQSFGQVSYGLLKALRLLGVEVNLFPIGEKINLGGFAPKKDLVDWISQSYAQRYSGLSSIDRSIRLWHISGSEAMIPAPKTSLLTFHETSKAAPSEKEILRLYSDPIVSSSYTKGVFADVPNVRNAHIGFDSEQNFPVDLSQRFDGEVHFGLMGKFEHRKHTAKIIRLWTRKYGNRKGFKLSCLVYNHMLDKGMNDNLVDFACENKKYWNVSFVDRLASNAEVNSFMNSVDVDLTGLSGGEGWNLPAFNMTCLGKWSIVLNATSHKDWATPQNSILVEPSGMIGSEDGLFFKAGRTVNLGMFHDFSEELFYAACEQAIKLAKKPNSHGVTLGKTMTYESMARAIIT